MIVRFKKLRPEALAPFQKHASDAAWDLHYIGESLVLFPGHTEKLATGLAFAIPESFFGDIRARSSTTLRGLAVAGVVDSSYRGEVFVLCTNVGLSAVKIESGERLAQLIVLARPDVTFKESEALEPTARNEDGFGASGR